MIYLENISEMQRVLIPKGRELASGKVIFKIHNLYYDGECKVNLNRESLLYYDLSVTPPENILPGEYEYSLSDNSGVLSSGVFVISGKSERIEYEVGEVHRLEYEEEWSYVVYDATEVRYNRLMTSDGFVLVAKNEVLFVKK